MRTFEVPNELPKYHAGILPAIVRAGCGILCLFFLCLTQSFAQTAFVNFNTVGQYTNNFNPWNDNGSGVNVTNYSFEESTNHGTGGSGGVSIYQSTDTTATYKTGSWNFATNGATIIVSTFVYASGGDNGDEVQLGVVNSSGDGLNSNTGIQFETFRFVPTSTTSWSFYEQYRSGNATTTSGALGTVSVIAGHWYKFVVGLTNTSGATGNLSAGCALFDYGANGLTPGTNLITFSTAESHAALGIAKNTSVWAAFRTIANAAVNAWDNFLVFTSKSKPVITLPLTNVMAVFNSTVTFSMLADGPGVLSYAWYTNGTQVAGVSGLSYTTPTLTSAFANLTNVAVVAANSIGKVTNQVSLTYAVALTNLPATSITATSATFGGQVLSTGSSTPAVTLYYGSFDGGTNAAAWSQSIALGVQSGVFLQSVSGLSSNTTYYFTAQATNVDGVSWASPSFSFTTQATNSASPLVPMLTYHNDNTRQGVNTNEATLTLANVNVNTFGRLFSYSVDGYVYGQPLVMTNVSIPGQGVHNVVYIVTEHESVYAFDADNNAGANSSPLWQVSFLNAAAGVTAVLSSDVGSTDITPEIGITATPVIDPVTGTMYVEAKTKEVTGSVTNFVHRLHALDITTGAECTNGPVSNSPVIINCTNYPGTGTSGYADNDGNGHVLFNALREHSRVALTLLNGVVYLGFASHGDIQPYHGWLFAYDAHTLAQLSVFNTTPNGAQGGFWQGGGGATVDSAGNFYLATGNGSFDATGTNFNQASGFAMSVLKFSPTNGVITLVDYFSPYNESTLSGNDQDLGSGAALVLPDSAGSVAHPHLLVAAGKAGPIYLLDRDNLGQFNSANNNQVVQELPSALGSGLNGSYMTPVFFNSTLYFIGMNNYLLAFPMSGGLIATNPSAQSPTFFRDSGSSSPTISANGTNNAIIWAIESDAYASSGPAILHAYNATNVALELYNSGMNQTRDNPGAAVKFAVPTVVNGKVYVGAEYALSIFGANPFLALPAISPDGGSFTNTVTVTLSDITPGVTLYYTLDGTTPTTNSTVYTSPFALANSANVQVIAAKLGSVNSAVASAGFINTSAVGNGTGLLGQYWSNQVMTFNGSPTLARTDATIDFDWDSSGPDPSIGGSNYTVRWTGMVQPQFSQTYTFYTSTDNGVRLWVNGQLLIDEFTDQSPTIWSGSIALQAQQYYNIEMDYFHSTGGGAGAELEWSSLSTPEEVIPESQLYPVTNPPPAVVLISPTNGSIFTGTASVTLTAYAAAQYNALSNVAFFVNNTLVANLTNSPYIITTTGLTPGTYTLTAIASDTIGLTATSAPVSITVAAGSGQPYGLTNLAATPAFLNMPGSFDGSTFSSLPQTLSQTGVFTNTPNMSPFGGLIPYSPNTPLWSDGALKIRYFGVPNTGTPLTPNQQISFAPTNTWSFPSGTVFVKTFELLTNTSDPTSILRLETRLLVRDTNGAVYGVTYKWRPDNSDADLLTSSSNQNIAITTPGGVVTQTWYYPSPSDCLTCHTPVANYVLGVNSRQLNGNFSYPNNTDNQLRTLNRLGLLNPAINEADISNYEQMYSVTNQTASLAGRARSYLDVNCAQCHQPGGTGPTFDARYDTPLTNQNLIYGVLAKGNLGYDNAYVVVPDDTWRSVLYDRINTTNSAIQMPPLARNLIDTNAVPVLAAWINSLPGTPALAPPTITPAGGTFNGFVSIKLQPPATNATLYYTIDGSLPTTNSLLYTSPFMLANSVTVNANAFETGFVNSVAANAAFTIVPNELFVPPGALSNGTFQVELSGVTGKSYIFQGSADLKTWTSLCTNVLSVNPFYFVDPGASNFSHRFYRVIEQP